MPLICLAVELSCAVKNAETAKRNSKSGGGCERGRGDEMGKVQRYGKIIYLAEGRAGKREGRLGVVENAKT